MHIHILGICGTFMGGVAAIAQSQGHTVTGSDQRCYPPISTQLRELGIRIHEGYDPAGLRPAPDEVVIGNALSRGNPAVEYVLDQGLPYTSGPEWLSREVLSGKWTLAVSGTHGKTTTASMLAWILECAGRMPGFLIGGVPGNFGISARASAGAFFVIEADEYDTAFFDKRSKFVHYRPRTLVINNLEFDHADIFPDLAAIQRQFHHVVRTVPGSGRIIAPARDPAVAQVLEQGCWSPVEYVGGGDWSLNALAPDAHRFEVLHRGDVAATVDWPLIGDHNAANALAAIAAAGHAGVEPADACRALGTFKTVRRRMEKLSEAGGVSVYDDFAHHPTAIATSLAGLRNRVGNARIIAVFEPGSNTMRMGVHRDTLAGALEAADYCLVYRPAGLDWDLQAALSPLAPDFEIHDGIGAIVDRVAGMARYGDHVLVMSNSGFGGIHAKLVAALAARRDEESHAR